MVGEGWVELLEVGVVDVLEDLSGIKRNRATTIKQISGTEVKEVPDLLTTQLKSQLDKGCSQSHSQKSTSVLKFPTSQHVSAKLQLSSSTPIRWAAGSPGQARCLGLGITHHVQKLHDVGTTVEVLKNPAMCLGLAFGDPHGAEETHIMEHGVCFRCAFGVFLSFSGRWVGDEADVAVGSRGRVTSRMNMDMNMAVGLSVLYPKM